MPKTLTISQRIDYNKRVANIKQFVNIWEQAAADLTYIRDRKLYLDDYRTFEAFVEGEFGFKRARAYQLIEASAIQSTMSTTVDTERQARALKYVAPEKRDAVVAEVKRTGKTVSAKAIREMLPASNGEVTVELDKDGYPVPPPAMWAWNRRGEMEELLAELRSVKRRVKALDPEDPMLVEVSVQSVLASIGDAVREFQQAIPTHVCGSCQGQTPKNCSLCKGRGVISDFRWLTVVSEVKTMRQVSLKKAKKK